MFCFKLKLRWQKIDKILQRDETSNASTPSKLLPIDQLISQIASVPLDPHHSNQPIQSSDGQAVVAPSTPSENPTSAEVSRRSSTSTQNTDTLTPVNLPSDPLDSHEPVSTSMQSSSDGTLLFHDGSVTTPNEESPPENTEKSTHQNQEDPMTNSIETTTNKSRETSDSHESTRESGSTYDASPEVPKPVAAPPARKISRFLVSPVVEKKLLSGESECRTPTETQDPNQQHYETETNTPEFVHQQPATMQTYSQVTMGVAHQQHLMTQIQSSQGLGQTSQDGIVPKSSQQQQPQVMQNVSVAQSQYQAQVSLAHQTMQQQNLQNISMQQNVIQQQSQTQQQFVQQHSQQVTQSQHTQKISQSQHTQQISQSQQAQHVSQSQHPQQIPQSQQVQQVPQSQHPQQIPQSQQVQQVPQSQHPPQISQSQHQQQMPQSQQVQQVTQPQQVQQIPQSQQVQQISQSQQVQQISQSQQVQQISQSQQIQQVPQAQQVQQNSQSQQVPQQQQQQQYVILSGHIPPIQQLPTDDRNRRVSNISSVSTLSNDSQLSETATTAPSSATNLQHTIQDSQNGNLHHQQITQPAPQLIQNPCQQSQETTPKIKTKEVSSTLPDLAQNLANILSNPKTKSSTPHAVAGQQHEPVQQQSQHPPQQSVQTEQYFQPIAPDLTQIVHQPQSQNCQPQAEQYFQSIATEGTQIVHQQQQIQQNIVHAQIQQAQIQQNFLNQQQSQNLAQMSQGHVATGNQQPIDVAPQSQTQSQHGLLTSQGQWVAVSAQSGNGNLVATPVASAAAQIGQQNVSMQYVTPIQTSQVLQQIHQAQQHHEQQRQVQQSFEGVDGSHVNDHQQHLQLRLPEQQTGKLTMDQSECNVDGNNANRYDGFFIFFLDIVYWGI